MASLAIRDHLLDDFINDLLTIGQRLQYSAGSILSIAVVFRNQETTLQMFAYLLTALITDLVGVMKQPHDRTFGLTCSTQITKCFINVDYFEDLGRFAVL